MSDMRLSDGYTAYEEIANVLEQIAKQYPADSNEVKALKEAAFGLCFALTKKFEDFQTYLAELDRPLTEHEEKYLRQLGLEP